MTSIPKIEVRKSADRGHANHGWLDTYHTFSFAEYYDPSHMGFRTLRVINEDRVQPGKGFGTHSHRDMEIITYVIEGALAHKDSMGNASVIEQGHVQRMSAGTGVLHSEFNASDQNLVHFLQIWIRPGKKDLEPSYQELPTHTLEGVSPLKLIGSQEGDSERLMIHQDVRLYFGELAPGQEENYMTNADRGIWIQVIGGEIEVEGISLKEGDGISIENIDSIDLKSHSHTRFLLFDLG